MTLFLLLGSDMYYPAHDNTIAIFEDRAQAEQVKEDFELIQDKRGIDRKRAKGALQEKYDFTPEYPFYDRFTIEDYEVVDEYE